MGTSRGSARQTRRSVLVVDDDADARAILRALLTAQGFYVSCAATAAEARERLRRRKFSLIVWDYFLPDAKGPGMLRKLRAKGLLRRTPVLMVTGGDPDEPAGIELLRKPLDFRGLFLRVHALVAP